MSNTGAQDHTHVMVDHYAEAAVLSAFLVNPDLYLEYAPALEPEHFAHPRHHAIFAAMRACEAAGRPCDAVTVSDQLRRDSQLDTAGGRRYLDRLANLATDNSNVAEHARIIAEHAQLRTLAAAGHHIAQQATAEDADSDTVLEEAEQRIFALGQRGVTSSARPLREAVPGTLERLAERRGRQMLGHSTGFSELDKLTSGLQPQQLVIIAARPSMGKSTFALNVAHHIAETTGELVYFASYEMATDELVTKLLSAASGIALDDVRHLRIPTDAERDFRVHAERLAEVDLLIDDNPPPTITALRSEARRVARRGPLAAVVVDYLQLMAGDRRREDSVNNEVGEISRGLKQLAKELEVPVLALSQLSRKPEERQGDKRPRLSDLRDSGAVEQDADMVWFPFRPSVYDASVDSTLAECIVAKQRNGALGTVHLTFDGPRSRFAERKTVVADGADDVF